MLYRVRYTFKNSDNKISWNDKLVNAHDEKDCVEKFINLTTEFVLTNIVEVRIFVIILEKYDSSVENKVCSFNREEFLPFMH